MNSYKRNENIQKKFSMRLITTFSTKQYVIKQILKQIQHEQNQQNANVPAAAITYETKTNGKKNFCYFYHIKAKKKAMLSSP